MGCISDSGPNSTGRASFISCGLSAELPGSSSGIGPRPGLYKLGPITNDMKRSPDLIADRGATSVSPWGHERAWDNRLIEAREIDVGSAFSQVPADPRRDGRVKRAVIVPRSIHHS